MKDEEYLARLQTRRQSDLMVIEGGEARERQDWAEAFRLVMQAVTLDPQSYYGQVQLAQFYKEKGDPEAAILHFERALAIYPKSIRVLESLIPLYEKIGRQDMATAAQKKAAELTACYQRPYIVENGVPVKAVNKLADMQDLHQLARKAVARELLQFKMYLDKNSMPYSDHMSEHWLRTWEYTGAIVETEVDSRMKVLDVGGTGTIFSYYLAVQGCRVTTVDIDQGKVDDAAKVSADLNLKMDHRCISITDVEFAENEFDRIFCICVIEHLTPEDQKTALKRMARFLKPGGLLYMTFDVGFNAADFPIVDEEQIRERYINASGLTLVGNTAYQFDANDLNLNHPDYCFGSLMLVKPGDGVRLPLARPAISVIKYE
jgi:2-polyprenyl-3-methyl-5-hydroxy-6-metoxy-1,4-benzoquinol methylase